MEYFNAKTLKTGTSDLYVFDIIEVPETNLLASSASDQNISLFDKGTLELVSEFGGHTNTIQQITTSTYCPSLLFSCSLDATIRCWDVRAKNPQVKLFSREGNYEYYSMSIGGKEHGEIVAASETAISFWDRRMGYYYREFTESHSQDITQVIFHPENLNYLYSASVDGLVCVFDITKKKEDDAFVDTYSVDHSVSKIGFYGAENEFLYVITNDERLSLWSLLTGNCMKDFEDVRDNFAEDYKLDYMIKCIQHPGNGKTILFGGSHDGDLYLYDISPTQFQPICSLKSGHNDVVRSIHWNFETDQIISGGEDGKIICWNYGHTTIVDQSDVLSDDININNNNNNNNDNFQINDEETHLGTEDNEEGMSSHITHREKKASKRKVGPY